MENGSRTDFYQNDLNSMQTMTIEDMRADQRSAEAAREQFSLNLGVSIFVVAVCALIVAAIIARRAR